MVMGPTPPGTGVIALATAAASSNATSPTRRVPLFASGSWLHPSSCPALDAAPVGVRVVQARGRRARTALKSAPASNSYSFVCL